MLPINRLFSVILLSGLLCACGDESQSSTTSTETTDETSETNDDSSTASEVSVLEWPVEEGYFGVPESTFTLTGVSDGSGIYFIDVQASFPDVDWETLDRLYIPAGHYSFIRLGNLPDRSSDDPLIISNIDGQVRVGGLGHYYLMVLSGGSNWVLTGRYDAESETGDVNYPGHRGGNFANSQDTYGIMVDDDYVYSGVSGLKVSDATEFSVEYLEIKEVDFAGMSMKTDDDGDALMEGVSLHDNYIHDTGSEGLYIGSTQSQPQHLITDWEIYNNRILRTGTEAIQLGQLAGVTKVHNNVFGPAAIDWRDAFQIWQDNNFQIRMREGHLQVYNNIFLGSAGSMILLLNYEVEGDETADNVGATFTDNYFYGIRDLGMYMNGESLEGMSFEFEGNSFGGYRYEHDEVYSSYTEYGYLLRIMNGEDPITLTSNTWYGPTDLTNSVTDNGTDDNLTATDNVNAEPEAITFVDSGLPDGFHILDLEMWAETASLGDDQPIDYAQGDIAMYYGVAYQCDASVCESGNIPPDHPEMWTELATFSDDVRVSPGTTYEALGLMPQ